MSTCPAAFARKPFAPAASPDVWVHTPTADAAFEELRDCLQTGRGIAVLTAPAGLGKTLLCCRLAHALQDHFRVLLFPGGGMGTPAAFLQAVLCDLDRPYRGMTEQELRLQLKRSVREFAQQTEGLILILDEAHTLDEAVLEEFRAATNLIENGRSVVRGLLSGQFPLEEQLTSRRLDALNQRIGCHVFLEPLARDESARYIREHLEQAGLHPADVFSPNAVRMICHAAGGNPRCLNRLCDRAMTLAERRGTAPVDETLVRRALDDLKQLPLHWNAPTPGDESDATTDASSADEPCNVSPSPSTGTFDLDREKTASQNQATFTADTEPTTADAETYDAPSAVIEVGAEATANPTVESVVIPDAFPEKPGTESLHEESGKAGAPGQTGAPAEEIESTEPGDDRQHRWKDEFDLPENSDTATAIEIGGSYNVDEPQTSDRQPTARQSHEEQIAGLPSFGNTECSGTEQSNRRPADVPPAAEDDADGGATAWEPTGGGAASPPATPETCPAPPADDIAHGTAAPDVHRPSAAPEEFALPAAAADWQAVELSQRLKRDAVDEVPEVCFGEQPPDYRNGPEADVIDAMMNEGFHIETSSSLPAAETNIDDHYARLRDEQARTLSRTPRAAGPLEEGHTAPAAGNEPAPTDTWNTAFADSPTSPASQTAGGAVPDCDSLLAADETMRPAPDAVVDSVIATLDQAITDETNAPQANMQQADAHQVNDHQPPKPPGGVSTDRQPGDEFTPHAENRHRFHAAEGDSGNAAASPTSGDPQSPSPESPPPFVWPFSAADADEYDVVLPEDENAAAPPDTLSDLLSVDEKEPEDEVDPWSTYGGALPDEESSPPQRPQSDLFTRLQRLQDDEERR